MKSSNSSFTGTAISKMNPSLNLWARSLVAAICCLAFQTFGQTPSLLWSTNIGAKLFAVDSQTNLYANAGGTVIKLSGSGIPLQTNSICPLPGVAQRDAAGNYYFAGTLQVSHTDGSLVQYFHPQDFGGGVILSNLPVYLAKFSGNGTLLWATNFGSSGRGCIVQEMVVDSEGNTFVGYWRWHSNAQLNLEKRDSSGARDWSSFILEVFGSYSPHIRVGLTSVSPTEIYSLIKTDGFATSLSRGDGNGTASGLADWDAPVTGDWSTQRGSRTVVNSLGEHYNVQHGNYPQGSGTYLVKRNSSGSEITHSFINGGGTVGVVGKDQWDGVYVATATAQVSRYDSDCDLVWTLDLPANCENMISDADGNRFLSLEGGGIARVGPEMTSAPVITNAPQPLTIFVGSNAVLNVGVSGSTPLRYQWRFSGTNLPSATNSTFAFNPAQTSQSGFYHVIISNHVGSVTSAPVEVRIKAVQLFNGNQMLTNGNYSYLTPPSISVRSAFASGSSFYTIDGSAPTFASTFYTGPFTVSNSATIRAIGYSADFSQSEEADAVNVILPVPMVLTASTPGGGSIALNPPGGPYTNLTVVTATATASNGWSFLYWTGAASGSNPSIQVTMDQNKSIQAIFGTTLATTVAGNGTILRKPAGNIFPYGTIVRLTAVPEPGHYFGVWGNAATGNVTPLYFTLTNSSPTISSIFAPTPANQAALTIVIAGNGHVTATPRANLYATNQSVTLTAIPDAGETFMSWGGDVAGNSNPLAVNMDRDRVVVANFTGAFQLRANHPGPNGSSAQGFGFTVIGDPFAVYQIFGSTNLINWETLGSITNATGEVQFTDPSATTPVRKFYRAAQ